MSKKPSFFTRRAARLAANAEAQPLSASIDTFLELTDNLAEHAAPMGDNLFRAWMLSKKRPDLLERDGIAALTPLLSLTEDQLRVATVQAILARTDTSADTIDPAVWDQLYQDADRGFALAREDGTLNKFTLEVVSTAYREIEKPENLIRSITESKAILESMKDLGLYSVLEDMLRTISTYVFWCLLPEDNYPSVSVMRRDFLMVCLDLDPEKKPP